MWKGCRWTNKSRLVTMEGSIVVCMRRKRGPKSTMLKDRDCDVTPLYYRSLLAPNAPGVGEECEVYCGDG